MRYGEHWIADVYEALRSERDLGQHAPRHHLRRARRVLRPRLPTRPGHPAARLAGLADPVRQDQVRLHVRRDGPAPAAVRVQLRSPGLPGAGGAGVAVARSGATSSSRRLQHTSVLATVRRMWALSAQAVDRARGPGGDVRRSVSEAADAPRTDCPTTADAAAVARREPAARRSTSRCRRPSGRCSPQVNHLDGHPDSGKPAPMPKTQGEASKYIAERNRAHAAHHDAQEGDAAATRPRSRSTPTRAATAGACAGTTA